ncbi:MAG: DUF1186 domain-containing protein [Lentisphaeria bacterium]
MPEMTMELAMAELGQSPVRRIPEEALAWVRANWPTAEPVLLEEMDKSIRDPFRPEMDERMNAALALCAEQRSRDAFPRYVALCRLPPVARQSVLDFYDLETMDHFLANTCHGRFTELQDMVADQRLEESVRECALMALARLAHAREWPREEFGRFLIHLLDGGLEREPVMLWDRVIGFCRDLGLAAAEPFIRRLYAETDASDASLLPIREGVIRDLHAGSPDDQWAFLDGGEMAPYEDGLADTLACGGAAPEVDAPLRRPPQGLLAILSNDGGTQTGRLHAVGRNEPCPCGSGKKYKKCCLDAVEQKARTPLAYDGTPVPEGDRELDQWCRAGFAYADRKQYSRACQCWHYFWKRLLERESGDGDGSPNAFHGSQSREEWLAQVVSLAISMEAKDADAEILLLVNEILLATPETAAIYFNLRYARASLMAAIGLDHALLEMEELLAASPQTEFFYYMILVNRMLDLEKKRDGIADVRLAAAFLEEKTARIPHDNVQWSEQSPLALYLQLLHQKAAQEPPHPRPDRYAGHPLLGPAAEKLARHI